MLKNIIIIVVIIIGGYMVYTNYMQNEDGLQNEGTTLQHHTENLINRIEGSLERIQRIRQRYARGPINRAAGYNDGSNINANGAVIP